MIHIRLKECKSGGYMKNEVIAKPTGFAGSEDVPPVFSRTYTRDACASGGFVISSYDANSGSVAVVTNFYAGLFGGPLSQLLKCLTAVKVCAEFKINGATAFPVCLVRHDTPPGFSPWEINLIDRHSKLHCLKTAGREDAGIQGDLEDIEKLFAKIEKIFPDGDRETLSALKEAFISDTNIVLSCANWLKYLFKDYGITIVEYDAFMAEKNPCGIIHKSLSMPVVAIVADTAEIDEYDKTPPKYAVDTPQPIVRPCPDATIINARSMKTLKRYGLHPREIFGAPRVFHEDTAKNVPERLQKIRDEAAAVLDELETGAFAGRGDRSARIREARAARIIYQLEKIQRHSRNAIANKEKTAESRISKARDFLSPLGRRQQDVLGGAQIPLFYGMAGLRALYERLDITTKNHQLIELD